jgi:sRNA-binding regulator protein Hfq
MNLNEKPPNKPIEKRIETFFRIYVGKNVKVILLNGITLTGTIEENVTYDILMRTTQNKIVIIPKHSIAYAEVLQ